MLERHYPAGEPADTKRALLQATLVGGYISGGEKAFEQAQKILDRLAGVDGSQRAEAKKLETEARMTAVGNRKQ